MDELTIDGKTYVSSKRAAQISGYAKDYVGQLCREGRIEARTVGRNWYVLLDALQGHRFKEEPEKPRKEVGALRMGSAVPIVTDSSWESPRYVPERLATMPSFSDHPATVNKLYEAPSARDMHAESEEQAALVNQMQDAWKEWFTQKAASEPVESQEAMEEAVEVPISPIGEEVEDAFEGEPEEEVSVHVERNYEEENTPEREEEPEAAIPVVRIVETKVSRREAESRVEVVEAAVSPYSRFMLQAVFAAVSIVALATALIGTDTINISGFNFLAGVEAINSK